VQKLTDDLATITFKVARDKALLPTNTANKQTFQYCSQANRHPKTSENTINMHRNQWNAMPLANAYQLDWSSLDR
jgi:hypothetical protein